MKRERGKPEGKKVIQSLRGYWGFGGKASVCTKNLGMEPIPLLLSSGCGTGCGYEFRALFLVRLQMTMLIFLSTSTPADIISPEFVNGLALP
jgi:hypothetical protein